ncbi:MAG TPA: hypothetical protein VGX50_06645 [Longimicrobium sp.]|jgi:hypothetical protein|nr:hypothetical protein [Longimicrobium sp.]
MQTIEAPPAAALASYSFRRGILEPEKTYTLYPDRLEIAAEGQRTEHYPLDHVDTVHLKYERTKQRAYFQCFIHTRQGHRISLRHVHWGGIARFEDRRESYTPFVRAVLQALAGRPGVRFKAGSMLNFIAAILGIPAFAALALLAFSLGSTAPGVFALFMLLLCIPVLRRSRPRSVDPLNPPASVLPL